MTADQVWNPSYSDNEIDPTDPSFYENTSNFIHCLLHVDYNVHGEYIHASHAEIPVSDTVPNDAPNDVTTPADAPAPVTIICP